MTEKPILLAGWGDTHSGSTEGLMRPRTYQFRDANVKPNARQRAIWRRFEQYTDSIASRRAGKRLVVVLNGDLVDGDHHGTHQLVTRKSSEQERLFTDCWDYFAQAVGFSDDDRVYVMRGTDLNGSHGAMDSLDVIGRDIGAIPEIPPTDFDPADSDDERKRNRAKDGWYPWQLLNLDILGERVQFTHHPPAGLGRLPHTRGNAVRNWLRAYQMRLTLRRDKLPRYVVWSHVHTAWRETMRLDDGTPNGPETTAVILPAFQGKTDYVYQRIPYAMHTTIGGWWAQFEHGRPPFDELEYVELNLERKAEQI